jgi:hypothetical protein
MATLTEAERQEYLRLTKPLSPAERWLQTWESIPRNVRRDWDMSAYRAWYADGRPGWCFWNHMLKFDRLDLPEETKRLIQDAFSFGRWRGPPEPPWPHWL